MKIKFIGDEFTCLGFSLAGVSVAIAQDKGSLEDEFDSALNDKDLGLLFITENEADLIREKVEKQKTEGEIPLVVEIPSRSGWKKRGRALQLINRVLSIKI